ncbi:MAG: type II toxin-antitoxin system RelE/ParE family toxin [Methylococcus sp.]|nr:MAG: type II toxin-antitoxin system RelE/ParE family toxin [Methylococcus sp.]
MIVRFEASFAKDLRGINDKSLLGRVGQIIDEVKQAESLAGIRSLKKLKGHDHYYRIRVGDYRLGLELAGEEFIFVRCLHRRDVYRYFP